MTPHIKVIVSLNGFCSHSPSFLVLYGAQIFSFLTICSPHKHLLHEMSIHSFYCSFKYIELIILDPTAILLETLWHPWIWGP